MFDDLFEQRTELLFESTDMKESTEPVYVMLTHTGTALSTLIKKATGVPYSHASISFDSSMKSMYSMGRKYKKIAFVGVFVKEDIKEGLFRDVADSATYSLYVTFVTPEEKEAMLAKLEELSSIHLTSKLKYSFLGLLYNKMNIAKDRGDKKFCSEFVAVILESGKNFFSKHTSLVRPYDYAKHKEFKFIKKGMARNYSQKEVDDRIAQIRMVNK